jgi:hypothetical protein
MTLCKGEDVAYRLSASAISSVLKVKRAILTVLGSPCRREGGW